MVSRKSAAILKLHLLVDGLNFSEDFLSHFKTENVFMEKRKVYNNPDEEGIREDVKIPQEIIIHDVVIAANYKRKSKWVLDFDNDRKYYIRKEGRFITEVSFSKKPHFLDLSISDGTNCGYIANLYGGKHLAFFTPAYCYYNNTKQGCLFCSLKNNRSKDDEYAFVISELMVNEVTKCALDYDADIIDGVMLVGGNLPDADQGFTNFLNLTEAIEEAQLNRCGSVIWETHIATMPPNNPRLIEKVNDFSARLTMNMEVFDDTIFANFCPGKNVLFGRQKLIESLRIAAETLDYGKTHSILIAGLEPISSTIEGIHMLAEMGVCPIINVFHNDYATPLQYHSRPKFEDLVLLGKELQKVYDKYKFTPYWDGCGRNSIDYEAKEELFI